MVVWYHLWHITQAPIFRCISEHTYKEKSNTDLECLILHCWHYSAPKSHYQTAVSYQKHCYVALSFVTFQGADIQLRIQRRCICKHSILCVCGKAGASCGVSNSSSAAQFRLRSTVKTNFVRQRSCRVRATAQTASTSTRRFSSIPVIKSALCQKTWQLRNKAHSGPTTLFNLMSISGHLEIL